MWVALRKESVDRNKLYLVNEKEHARSLSARRAWIEIKSGLQPLIASLVALRKESVDRNYIIKITEIWGAGRSPQGERG